MSKFDPYDHLKITLNSDGSLIRNFNVQTVEVNPSPSQNELVASKDVTLNPGKKTWVRIFKPTRIPSNEKCIARLPLLIYFHGGGWFCHSPADVFYHEKCASFATEIPSVVVSLHYRKAPEHKLPAQYEDAVDAILWAQKQATNPHGEQWLRDYADFSKCYLTGRMNGANMAFNAALRVLDMNLRPLSISGIILNQPMFGGKNRTKSELKYASDDLLPLPVLDLLWELALPKGTDRDHRYCNPMSDNVQQQKLGNLAKCLVIGYGGDAMLDKQQELVAMLAGCGTRVVAHFDDVGFHGIDLVDQKRALFNMQRVQEFILS